MTAPEIPEGRCVVCWQAWDPCRRCKGKATAAKCAATMAARGTTHKVPRPKDSQRISLKRDPAEFRHLIEPKGSRGDVDA